MSGLVRRSYQPGDADALAELMNAIDEQAGGRPASTGPELRELIEALVHDVRADSGLVFTADGELVAAGFTTTPPAGGFRVYLTGGVHPAWRGRGLGREILARHLARAGEIHRATAPHTPWEAQIVRTPVGDDSAPRLYRRLGLAPVRWWFEMAAPAVTGPSTVDPVGYAPTHDADLHAAHHEAFADNWGFQHRDLDTWTDLTVRSDRFAAALSPILVRDNEIAAYALTYRHPDPTRVYVGQVGVRRRWRRQGLAAGLLTWVLDAAARAGHTTVSLSVDADSPTGAVSVYERVGFVADYRAVTHSLTLTASATQDAHG